MVRATAENRDRLLAWAAERIPGLDAWPEESKAIGIVDGDGARQAVRAVCVYNTFLDQGCSVHLATDGSRRWASRSMLRVLFGYPLQQLKLRRLSAYTTADNIPAQVLLLKLGFRFEGVQRAAYQGRDMVMMGLLAEECRWLPSWKGKRHG